MALKDNVLAALETNRQAALSGQALAARFGVSRNAVWKAVSALKAEGYAVESAPNRGYRLSPACDRLSGGAVRALLGLSAPPVHCFDTLTSTNDEAKRRLAGGEAGPFLVLAEEQTAGRGRRGRTFYSPKGAGLYMTVAFPAGLAAENALGVTAYAAVCVAGAVERLTGKDARIKWVNDLYLDGKKICGILTEAVTDFESGALEALLVGVGVNLRPVPLPAPLAETVGFLSCDKPLKNPLAAAIAEALLRYPPADTAYLAAYRKRSMTLGRNVLWTQGDRSGTGRAEAIDESGALVVRGADGALQVLKSGEITLLPD